MSGASRCTKRHGKDIPRRGGARSVPQVARARSGRHDSCTAACDKPADGLRKLLPAAEASDAIVMRCVAVEAFLRAGGPRTSIVSPEGRGACLGKSRRPSRARLSGSAAVLLPAAPTAAKRSDARTPTSAARSSEKDQYMSMRRGFGAADQGRAMGLEADARVAHTRPGRGTSRASTTTRGSQTCTLGPTSRRRRQYRCAISEAELESLGSVDGRRCSRRESLSPGTSPPRDPAERPAARRRRQARFCAPRIQARHARIRPARIMTMSPTSPW